MKYLMHMFMPWIDRENGSDADERSLALSVDAHQFEVRIWALERRAP